MKIFKVIFDHDLNERFTVAAPDGVDAFSRVYDWAIVKAKGIYKELRANSPGDNLPDEVAIDTIEFLYHVDASTNLKIEATT